MVAIKSIFMALAAVLLSSVVKADSDGVLALDPDNFYNTIGKAAGVFVEFYAPWCGHCKNLAPVWANLGTTFKPNSDKVIIAKVDADAHRELATEFDVRGYPTLKWFPAGSNTPEDYNGGRSEDDLIEFVNSKTGLRKTLKTAPSPVVALTPETFDATVADSKKFKLVEFYAPWCGHCKNLAPTYEKLGAAFEGEESVVIAKVDADKHRTLGERFDVSGFPTIKYFPIGSSGAYNPDDVVEPYQSGRDLQDFITFINEAAGTARAADGSLLESAGRIPSIDSVIASGGDVAVAVASATFEGPYAQFAKNFYSKIAEKVKEKGQAYVTKESARVQGLLASDSISPVKKTELSVKINILNAFKTE